ncbi:MAG TPA: DinB family protein, partial [Thermoanaerobaculia bacterium]
MFFEKGLVRVRRQLVEMRRLASLPEAQLFAVTSVSAWTPSEHLDHSLKVATWIVQRVLDPAPERGRPFSFIGLLILWSARIPRGRGKAPERVRGARATREELMAAIDSLEAHLARLNASLLERKRGPIVPHPMFGSLTPPQALRFAAVHTDHHLRIVKDVLRSSGAAG